MWGKYAFFLGENQLRAISGQMVSANTKARKAGASANLSDLDLSEIGE
jgi:hypothetical protein